MNPISAARGILDVAPTDGVFPARKAPKAMPWRYAPVVVEITVDGNAASAEIRRIPVEGPGRPAVVMTTFSATPHRARA